MSYRLVASMSIYIQGIEEAKTNEERLVGGVCCPGLVSVVLTAMGQHPPPASTSAKHRLEGLVVSI